MNMKSRSTTFSVIQDLESGQKLTLAKVGPNKNRMKILLNFKCFGGGSVCDTGETGNSGTGNSGHFGEKEKNLETHNSGDLDLKF